MSKVHPTAIIDKGAKLASDVEVGPYSVIGAEVEIGEGTSVASHVVLSGRTVIGKRCAIFSGAYLGAPGQVSNYKALKNTSVKIGDDNIIREHVTVHAGSTDGAQTVVGDRNFLMIGCHVAHDDVIGNDTLMANGVTLAGYVTVEDHAVLGGLVGVHQHSRIGKYSMIGGLSRVVMDIPPFSICSGHPARFYGLNAVGLRRAKFASKDAMLIKKALKTLFVAGLPLQEAIAKVKNEMKGSTDVDYLVNFVEKSKRGMVRVPIAGQEEDVLD